MSDTTPTTGEETTTPAQQEPAAPQDAQTVPYARFQEVNQQAKQYRNQLDELSGRLQELEDRDKSEVERATQRAQKFEQQATEMAARLQRVEKHGMIRAAAADAGFDDPDDAVAFLAGQDIETSDDAEKAVKRLAKRKPRLLKGEPAAPPIGQVVQNGQQVQPGAQQQGQPISPEAEALLAQVRAVQEAGWTATPVQ